MSQPLQSISRLAAALGLAALVLALPAWLRFGPVGLEGIAIACLACLVPGVLLVLVSGWFRGSQRVLQMLLVGTGLRISFVLLTALLLMQTRPALDSTEFLLGLSVFYFVALAVETRQLFAEAVADSGRRSKPAAAEPGQVHG